METVIWIGIIFCLSQSAMFSGLNLAFFSITRLRLEIEVANGNKNAEKILNLRSDSNFLLSTILWGNVSINVLLTLLSNSVMAGVLAFVFSTFLITFFGEIIPQAYFSRNAIRMASFLTPLIKLYQKILYFLAKPTALLLDLWLGKESIILFKEQGLKQLIKKHIEDSDEIDKIEGFGALNFLHIDDLLIEKIGEDIHPDSIIKVKIQNESLILPEYGPNLNDKFLERLNYSNKKWTVLINEDEKPEFVMDTDGFLRGLLFNNKKFKQEDYVHKPILVYDPKTIMGEVLIEFVKNYDGTNIKNDIILLWSYKKKIITGSDILALLLNNN